ncbi:MAG: murein biosynthesis integral membrane protein MurJ [Polyangiaceae bacterium]|nr:murein biosynthesis integral membrane protein MurJ [Polyangiaceae bacterium]
MTTNVSRGGSEEVASKLRPVHDGPRHGAAEVAAGIFASRIVGFIRERVLAHYFGTSEAADAFRSALRIPNFLQNLFGDGVLSGSFIPVYARLLGEKNQVEADRVAGVVATLLAIVVSILALIGVLITPFMISLIAPGFEGEKRLLTIRLVRILFPGIALLVMSAWCLGILNSHRRFFLSYAAPVVWNLAIIGTLLLFGGRQAQLDLAVTAAWGLVLGCFLQLAVQLPTVFKLLTKFRPSVDIRSKHVQNVLGSFGSVVVARGVVQISAYVDNMLASLSHAGAVSVLGYAQTLSLLPISLFGMSVSAVSLAEMARSRGEGAQTSTAESNEALRTQLERGLRQIAFFIVPSMTAYMAVGDVVIAALYKTGKFSQNDIHYVWAALAGSALGLLPSTLGRLYSSTFYAVEDTRSPLRFAIIRVALTTALGYVAGVRLPRYLGFDMSWSIACITVTSSVAGWIELLMLRNRMNDRIGRSWIPWSFLWRISLAALVASAIAVGVRILLDLWMPWFPPFLAVVPIFGCFGTTYLGAAVLLRIPEATSAMNRVTRRVRRRH